MDVTFKDFQPINQWAPEKGGRIWWGTGEPRFIIDLTTKRKYSNEPLSHIRFKCFLLTLGTPFVHAIAGMVHIARRIFGVMTLYHFKEDLEKNAAFKAKLQHAGTDILYIIAIPFAYLGLELSALYGLLRPHDGRKLYASIERGTYGHRILAPCFQPEPSSHFFGGDINSATAF